MICTGPAAHDCGAVTCTTRTYALALACGVVLALGFPSWQWHPLTWAALAPLFFVSHRLKPTEGFKLWFAAGWAFYSVLLQWLMANIYWAGGWAIWG